jgi:hypothetical protein
MSRKCQKRTSRTAATPSSSIASHINGNDVRQFFWKFLCDNLQADRESPFVQYRKRLTSHPDIASDSKPPRHERDFRPLGARDKIARYPWSVDNRIRESEAILIVNKPGRCATSMTPPGTRKVADHLASATEFKAQDNSRLSLEREEQELRKSAPARRNSARGGLCNQNQQQSESAANRAVVPKRMRPAGACGRSNANTP